MKCGGLKEEGAKRKERGKVGKSINKERNEEERRRGSCWNDKQPRGRSRWLSVRVGGHTVSEHTLQHMADR